MVQLKQMNVFLILLAYKSKFEMGDWSTTTYMPERDVWRILNVSLAHQPPYYNVILQPGVSQDISKTLKSPAIKFIGHCIVMQSTACEGCQPPHGPVFAALDNRQTLSPCLFRKCHTWPYGRRFRLCPHGALASPKAKPGSVFHSVNISCHHHVRLAVSFQCQV